MIAKESLRNVSPLLLKIYEHFDTSRLEVNITQAGVPNLSSCLFLRRALSKLWHLSSHLNCCRLGTLSCQPPPVFAAPPQNSQWAATPILSSSAPLIISDIGSSAREDGFLLRARLVLSSRSQCFCEVVLRCPNCQPATRVGQFLTMWMSLTRARRRINDHTMLLSREVAVFMPFS